MRKKFTTLLKRFFLFLIFPLSHIYFTLKSNSSKKRKILHTIFSLMLLPIWIIILYVVGYFLLPELGFPLKPFEVMGDSMLPSLKDHTIIGTRLMKSFLGNHKPERGDVVVFQNAKTLHENKPVDFIKRVIGIEGDKVKISEGQVYLNDSLFKEPYIYEKKSTWSENFCKDLIVPKGFVFVMGDNRSRSDDSREFGLVSTEDIVSYLSLNDQSNYKNNWQTKGGDFNIDEFITLINKKREESGASDLIKNPLLVSAADKRVYFIFKYSDTSYTATRSGYKMSKALNDVGFNNVGYFNELVLKNANLDTNGLVDYFMKDENLKKYILDKNSSMVGISNMNGEFYNCSANVKELVLF